MKKVFWLLFAVLVAFTPVLGHAQVSVYGEFSVSDFHNLLTTDYLSGATTGVLVDGPLAFHHLQVAGNIQGRFLAGNGEKFNSLAVGPRVTFKLKHTGKIAPFAEFLVGFGRFHGNALTAMYFGNANNQSTDGLIQVNGGVSRKVSARWDVVVDYSYSQYYGYGGQYNPKTYGIGAIYHFKAR